jgi:hypothetical protein
MTYNDPLNRSAQRPPDVDPIPSMPPGSNPPRYRDIDRTGNWSTGIIVAAVAALLVAVGSSCGPVPPISRLRIIGRHKPRESVGKATLPRPTPRSSGTSAYCK